jgi:Flp pilus assembly protein TadG
VTGCERRFLRRRTERGAAALEFAFVFPLLVMLLIGIGTTGLVYFDHSSASNAVREAARYGASADATTPATWASSVRDRLKATYFNSTSTVSDSQICVDLVQATSATAGTTVSGSALSGADCGTAPDLPASMTPGSCIVRVWMAHPEKITLVIFPAMNFTIAAQSVAYYGRTVPTTGTPVCTAN